MKMNIAMSVLVFVAGLSVGGGASAQIAPPYLLCNYKGQINLAFGSIVFACWSNLTLKVGCEGDTDTVYMSALGLKAGDTSCPGLFIGNLPWTTSLAAIFAGTGAIDTTNSTGGGLPWSMIDGATLSPIAGGSITGVSATGGVPELCSNGDPITIPDRITVSGTNNMGPMLGVHATINTVAPNHWAKRGCL